MEDTGDSCLTALAAGQTSGSPNTGRHQDSCGTTPLKTAVDVVGPGPETEVHVAEQEHH